MHRTRRVRPAVPDGCGFGVTRVRREGFLGVTICRTLFFLSIFAVYLSKLTTKET